MFLGFRDCDIIIVGIFQFSLCLTGPRDVSLRCCDLIAVVSVRVRDRNGIVVVIFPLLGLVNFSEQLFVLGDCLAARFLRALETRPKGLQQLRPKGILEALVVQFDFFDQRRVVLTYQVGVFGQIGHLKGGVDAL